MVYKQLCSINYLFSEGTPYSCEEITNAVNEIIKEVFVEDSSKVMIKSVRVNYIKNSVLNIKLPQGDFNIKEIIDKMNNYILGTFNDYIKRYNLVGIDVNGDNITPIVESGYKDCILDRELV